jgi:hypothetical protein
MDRELEGIFEEIIEQEYSELVLIKRNSSDRKIRRKKIKRAHKGTNWNTSVPKAGFKRVKVGKRYVRVRMSSNERLMKKRVGKMLGHKKF